MISLLTALSVCLATVAATMEHDKTQSYGGSGMDSSSSGMGMGMSSEKDMSSSGDSGMSSGHGDVDMSHVSSDGKKYSWNSEQTSCKGDDAWSYKANMGDKDTDHYMSSGDGYSGKTWQVTVGGTGLLTFQPQTVTAAKGDRVQFNFMSTNHTLTQSSFGAPCTKMDGIDSGFMPNPNNMSPPPYMMIQVNSTNPVWFYCKQKGHCGKGMTFSLNPCADKTDAAFHAAAMASGASASMSMMTTAAASMAPPAATPMPMSTSSMMPPPPPPPAAAAPPASGMTSGSASGQCGCQCLCNSNAFPAGVGMGMMGGMPGMMASM